MTETVDRKRPIHLESITLSGRLEKAEDRKNRKKRFTKLCGIDKLIFKQFINR